MGLASNNALALLMGFAMASMRTIGAADSSIIHSRALATSSSTMCPTEQEACKTDESCLECIAVIQVTIEECFDGLNSSTADCDDFGAGLCCALAPGDGCADNPLLEQYLGCKFESVCPVDFGLCTEAGAATTPTTTTTSADDIGDESTTSSRGISGSDSTTTADDGDDAASPISGGDDGDSSDGDATLAEGSSAPPSAVATMTTRASLLLVVVIALIL